MPCLDDVRLEGRIHTLSLVIIFRNCSVRRTPGGVAYSSLGHGRFLVKQDFEIFKKSVLQRKEPNFWSSFLLVGDSLDIFRSS